MVYRDPFDSDDHGPLVFALTWCSVVHRCIIELKLIHVYPGVLLKATWMQGGCVITKTSNKILAASFIYGMTFDLIVLCLTGIKLAFPTNRRSKLVSLIFGDGLIFFIVA
jgi:hypothetical protein